MPDDKAPPKNDPYDDVSSDKYECVDCGHRLEADSQPGDCPDCGGAMRDISRPSER